MAFHRRTGTLILLTHENRTAQRRYASTEFNNGIVMSSKPLKDNEIFEVRIDKRLNSWSGSVEIGVTSCNPDTVSLPTSATGLRDGTWILSGCTILKDGSAVKEDYGEDLEKLTEGDTLGVMRTSSGILHFFVNGQDQGAAASLIPHGVYAVVDIYGKCMQVTVNSCRLIETNRSFLANQLANEAIAEAAALCSNERLAFHEKHGSLVRLTNGNRTAERLRPSGEFNNAVVMTNRPLKVNEMFEIRLDRTIDKWSGSIEVGITTHNPSLLEFPATMTNMRSGTIMMSGSGILTNGKGTQREYGQFNLDELTEGDRIGLMRKSNGCLHFYINSIDQGVAAESSPDIAWGVVDLYGMAVKVTILDEPAFPETSRTVVPSSQSSHARELDTVESDTESSEIEITSHNDRLERLAFHPVCGKNVTVLNRNRTAKRPDALEEFNHGVVLSNRPLMPAERFEIRIERVTDKWAGSLEIGVTTHDPMTLDFPPTMGNFSAGAWMLTANGITHNGHVLIENYGLEEGLRTLKPGDTIGVSRNADSKLYFFINGRNLGLAAENVPEHIYGVLDLYGQATEASVVQSSGEVSVSDLRFHEKHGNNCVLVNGGLSAVRPSPNEEFSGAVLMSNRCLKPNELFEIMIDRLVDRWSGSLEIGVTTISPESLNFPSCSMSDYRPPNTWMLVGSSVMQEGITSDSNMNFNIETLPVGARVGLLVSDDHSLHVFIDGIDKGVVCSCIPAEVYAVVELYGACAGVTITNGCDTHQVSREGKYTATSQHDTKQKMERKAQISTNHRFSQCCGKHISLNPEQTSAQRVKGFNNGILLSADPLRTDDLFEVAVDQVGRHWSGSMMIGLTTQTVSQTQPIQVTQSTALEFIMKGKHTWIINGSKVAHDGKQIREGYFSALDRLDVGSRVGIKRCSDGTMHLFINGTDMGAAATGIPRNVFVILDLHGAVEGITVMNRSNNIMNDNTLYESPVAESMRDEIYDVDTQAKGYHFHLNCGKHIQLSHKNLTACRTSGYNHAVIISDRALTVDNPFTVRIDKLNSKWKSSLLIGVTACHPNQLKISPSAASLQKKTWIISGTSVFYNNKKIKSDYGPDLNTLPLGSRIGLSIDSENCLHLHNNGIDMGVAAENITTPCYALVDLYGMCYQVSIVNDCNQSYSASHEDREKADMDNSVKEKIKKHSGSSVFSGCQYQQICDRFIQCIAIPEEYFNVKSNKCFCESCYKQGISAPYMVKGHPPKEYTVPVGWMRYGLKVKPRDKAGKQLDNWNIAYSGTSYEMVRKVLDFGDLFAIADSCSKYSLKPCTMDKGEEKKTDTFESVPVILSPSVKYAACSHFSQPVEYRDLKAQKLFKVKLVFEACAKPGSFNYGPQTIETDKPQDSKLNHGDIEWSTKEKGSVEISGLLVKLEPL